MNLEDIKERLKSEWQRTTERLQENPAFIKVQERYQNLGPTGQKLTLIGSGLLVLVLLVNFPLGFYSQSSDHLSEFENTRQLIRELFKASQEAREVPNLPVPPSLDQLRMQIENQLNQAQLLPEQIKNTASIHEAPEGVLPDHIAGGFRVTLSQLNLRQAMDIGYQLQALHPSMKLVDLIFDTNAKDSRYLDAIYKLAVIKIPDLSPPAPELPASPAKKAGGLRK